jgi:hypothetical protein
MNFNFGEHYYQAGDIGIWVQIGLAFIAAMLGFSFSLLIFYIQTRKDKKKEENEVLQANLNLLFYFKELLISTKKNHENQIEFITEFINDQNNDLAELIVLKQVATENYDRLKSLDGKELFQAWTSLIIEPNNILNYKKISSALDFLLGTKKEILRIYLVHNERIYQKISNAKILIDHVPDKLSSIALKSKHTDKENYKNDPYYQFINFALNKYGELIDSKKSISVISEELLLPILDAYLNHFPLKAETEEIMTTCKKARVLIGDTKIIVKGLIEELEKVEERTKSSSKTIANAIEKITNLP